MPNINEDILSEINNMKDGSQELREFLKWLIEFESQNSDKDRFSYKEEIDGKIEDLIQNT